MPGGVGGDVRAAADQGFIGAAGERGFPVVEVPIPVPFMAISQEVAAAVQGDTGQRLNAQLQVFGAVQWLAAGNLTAAEIFARLERLSGYSLYACTLRRTRLLDGLPVPPPSCADLIPGTVTSPPTVPGGYVLPVTGPRGTAGYILAMESPDAAPGGVSVGPFTAGSSVAVARREARWALARALEAGRAVVSYGDDRTGKWLTSEAADLRVLAEQVLGAVVEYNEVHGTGLVPSVRVWLEHDRQTDRAARALHVHPNTLLYRIRRFEQISGRSLASTESLAEVWLAMRTTAAVPEG